MREVVQEAVERAFGSEAAARAEVQLEVPRDRSHGDWATNVAMLLARVLKRPPRDIAGQLAERLRERDDWFGSVEVAGPGFINLRLNPERLRTGLGEILRQGEAWGRSPVGADHPVMVEFVSANPTGPLNVVNARAAAFGGALVRLLDASGHRVSSEFYINDVGRQIDLLGESVWARHRQLNGEDVPLPEEGYQGEYVVELARELTAEDIREAGDDPRGPRDWMSRKAVRTIRSWQERDLAAYGTRFDRWFHQHELYPDAVEATLRELEEAGHVFDKDGARWFASTRFGDDQDRVVVRAGGDPTYFLADLAYHGSKFKRGVKTSIDIWGPDHHGYIPRMQAGMQALGYGPDWLEVLIVQQVNLLSGGQQVKMSKRKGEFITLEELVEEVGKDTARFFFLQRRAESHLDFDIDLAKKESDENPVFYVKYAHARIAGILRKATEEGATEEGATEEGATEEGAAEDGAHEEGTPRADALKALEHPAELDLIKILLRFPDLVAGAARDREPHRVTGYLREVSQAFHGFYHHCRVVGDDARQTAARLALCRGTRRVLANGLALLDVQAPDRM